MKRSEFRLESDGRHVDFAVVDRDQLIEAVKTAAEMLWNALHHDEIEQRVEEEKGRLIKKYGSTKAAVDAFMRHMTTFVE